MTIRGLEVPPEKISSQMALTFDLSSPVIVFESKQFRKTEDILIQELGGGGTIPYKQLYQKAEDQDIIKKVL